jgi:hypothetical protein
MNTPMQGVLTLELELWVFGSFEGLQVPTFGSVSFIFTFNPKWGCNTFLGDGLPVHMDLLNIKGFDLKLYLNKF